MHCNINIIKQLLMIYNECKNASIPQKWIGSSIGIGFESGLIPHNDLFSD